MPDTPTLSEVLPILGGMIAVFAVGVLFIAVIVLGGWGEQ